MAIKIVFTKSAALSYYVISKTKGGDFICVKDLVIMQAVQLLSGSDLYYRVFAL